MFYCLFLFSSASVIPEVRCLISPHQSVPPPGRVDLLIGSCDQTYGGTRHRPQLPGDKSRLVGFFPPLSPCRGAEEPGEQHRGRELIRPLDGARCKQIHPSPFPPFNLSGRSLVFLLTHRQLKSRYRLHYLSGMYANFSLPKCFYALT